MAWDAAAAAVPVVVAEAQSGVKKAAAAARNWILFDSNGEGTILDVDKYAIMHRVEINARDLRILDPLLSYPSAILGRETAIVLNLEVSDEFSLIYLISLLILCVCFFFFFSC